MDGGRKIILPAFVYPLFKRVFWKHLNGVTFEGRWAHVWLWWRCNT